MNIFSHARPPAILVVDDHELVRLGVRALLQSQVSPSGSNVDIFEAASLGEALALYERHQSDIRLVLLDLALPDTQGLSGVVQFHARFPQARIAVISGVGGLSLAQGGIAQSAVALGACAFLPKTSNLKHVVSFIRACGIIGNGAVDLLPPAANDRHQNQAVASSTQYLLPEQTLQTLSPRHIPVFQLMLEGKNNREIAQAAQLSEGTVKNYVSTILLRCGVRSRAELISSLR